jgi:hypothetical protein
VSTTLTIKGVYRGGKVEFSERPEGVGEEVPVFVTFPTKETTTQEIKTNLIADQTRRDAAERFLARLKEGIPFGGPPYPKREELYDRIDRTDEGPG